MRKWLIAAALLIACFTVSQNALAQDTGPDEQGFYPLHLAVRAGDIEKVERLIKKGADVNQRQLRERNPKYGWPPLFYALNKPEIMKILLEAEADVDVRVAHGETLILKAAQNGQTEAVELLLSHDAEINDGENSPALLAAIVAGHIGIAKQLVEHDAKFRKPPLEDKTPWELATDNNDAFPNAVATGDLPLVESMLQRGADPHDRVAWCLAASKGRFKMLEHLMRIAPDRTGKNISQRTLQAALTSAVVFHQKEVADFLLESGAHRSALETGLREAIRRAVFTGDRELAEQLFERSNDSVWKLDKGSIAGLGLVVELRKLLSNAPHLVHTLNPNYPGINMTPLHAAAMNGRNEVVAYLLEIGAGPSTPDQDGFTPLHLAVRHGHKETAKLLIDGGANVNATTVRLMGLGEFPVFMEAMSIYNLEMIAMLDELGVDMTSIPSQELMQPPIATRTRLITFSRWVRAGEKMDKDLAVEVNKEVEARPPLWSKDLDFPDQPSRKLHLFKFEVSVIMILTNAENQVLSSVTLKTPQFDMNYAGADRALFGRSVKPAHIEPAISQTDEGRLISLRFVDASIEAWSLQMRLANDELHKSQDPPDR